MRNGIDITIIAIYLIGTVIFGCRDNRAGAVESLFNVLSHPLLNHRPQVIGGILEDRCAAAVRAFFTDCRAKER